MVLPLGAYERDAAFGRIMTGHHHGRSFSGLDPLRYFGRHGPHPVAPVDRA
jgi:hypothetical protein